MPRHPKIPSVAIFPLSNSKSHAFLLLSPPRPSCSLLLYGGRGHAKGKSASPPRCRGNVHSGTLPPDSCGERGNPHSRDCPPEFCGSSRAVRPCLGEI